MIDVTNPCELEVVLFGFPSVRVRQTPIALSPQQLRLVTLVYASAPLGLSRPEAAHLLWGRRDLGGRRQGLRQLLFMIRRRVHDHLILAAGDVLSPNPDARSDLDAFEEALGDGRLSRAAALARQRFAVLPVTSGSDDFDDFRVAKERSIRKRLRGRASAQWTEAITIHDWHAAHEAAQALHAVHPGDPVMVERVIEARARLGMRESAECFFASYVESLDAREDPAAIVVEAIRRAREAWRRSDALAGDRPSAPFVGRSDEIARVRTVIDSVQEGRFALGIVTGESGIGKTRVLQELYRDACLRGVRCLRAAPVELESRIPLNPLLDALSDVDLQAHLEALGGPWAAVMADTMSLGSLDDPPQQAPHIDESALPRRLMDTLRLLFERLAAEAPTLLFLDDMHWVDATTVTALQFIQRRWRGGPLGIIAAVRPELVTDNDPVSLYLMPGHHVQVQRVHLGELSNSEAKELVMHAGKGRIADEAAGQICTLAGNHPLYLTEIAREFLAGTIQLPQIDTEAVAVPTSLRQMLRTRLNEVSDQAMNVAGMLAAAAKPMRIAELAALTAQSVAEVAASLEQLTDHGLVHVDCDSASVAHDLLRSAIYAHIGPARRAAYHRTLAAFLLTRASDESAGELAMHFSRAGDAEAAAIHGQIAAKRAMASGAVAEAAYFYQLVADRVAGPQARAHATAGLAQALYLARDLLRAASQLELAARRLRIAGDPRGAARMEIKRVEALAELGSESIARLLERLDKIKVAAQARSDPEAVALALDVELHLLYRSGDSPGIHRVLAQMREVASGGSPEAALLSHAGLALGVLFGDSDEALRSARESVRLAEHGKSYRLRALLRLLVVLQYRGMLTQGSALSVIAEARALAERSGDLQQRFIIESNLATAALDAGDLERAEALMRKSSEMLGSADMDLNRFKQANNQAELALAQGNYYQAEAAFTEAATYIGPMTPAYMGDLVNAGLGLCAFETGRLTVAHRLAEALRPAPARWFFDPCTIVAFRVRTLLHRGRRDEALKLLDSTASDLENRLTLAWLKVRIMQVRILARGRDPLAQALAREASNCAARLGIHHRVNELTRLTQVLGIA